MKTILTNLLMGLSVAFCANAFAETQNNTNTQADNTQADNVILPGLDAATLENKLQTRFTENIANMINNAPVRDQYLRQLLLEMKVESQAKALELDKTEEYRAELAAKKMEMLRDALIKHELERALPDIEALAQERYAANINEYRTRRKIKLAQIYLIKEDNQQAEKKKLADDLLARLRKDEKDFAEKYNKLTEALKETDSDEVKEKFESLFANDLFTDLAKEHSEDKFASKGGFSSAWLLAPNNPDKKVPDVVKAAFALTEVGQISDVIESTHGYHIMRLVADTPSRILPYENVRDQIIGQIKNELWRSKALELEQKYALPADVEINEALALEVLKKVYAKRDKPSAPDNSATPTAQAKPESKAELKE